MVVVLLAFKTEEEREERRETPCERDARPSLVLAPTTRDRTCSPGLCPIGNGPLDLSAYGTTLPPTEPHRPAHGGGFEQVNSRAHSHSGRFLTMYAFDVLCESLGSSGHLGSLGQTRPGDTTWRQVGLLSARRRAQLVAACTSRTGAWQWDSWLQKAHGYALRPETFPKSIGSLVRYSITQNALPFTVGVGACVATHICPGLPTRQGGLDRRPRPLEFRSH